MIGLKEVQTIRDQEVTAAYPLISMLILIYITNTVRRRETPPHNVHVLCPDKSRNNYIHKYLTGSLFGKNLPRLIDLPINHVDF